MAKHRGSPGSNPQPDPHASGGHGHGSHEGGHQGGGMGTRGVTRPMAEREAEGQHHGGHGHEMGRDDRLEMLRMHHRQTLWIYWMLPILGVWTMLSPATFGYLNESHWVDPSGGRGAWFGDQTHTALRAGLMTWSDVISGLLLVVLGWRALTPNRPVTLWACCFVGIWMTFAPVLFWAPTASSYLNGTVVGALVIALTILVPGMPNMIMYIKMGPPTPPGWSYNPSSWPQRWIMIATGLAGWLVSRYLAAFQLGYIDYVWDPLFGFAEGTERVLDSAMSHSWPLSDAGFGALAYTFEFLMGWMGSPARWRTMPWMVAFFGILVIPLGLTHIILVASQPLIVHHWCSMCLLAAAIMLPMIPLEVDEVVAMIQHVSQARRRGDRGGSLWRIFWKGGEADGCEPDDRSPELMSLPEQPGRVFKASIWGMSFPRTLVASSALGLGLMAAPTLSGLEITTTAADVGHLGGALILTVSVVCMGEVVRIGRYLNMPIGLAVAAAPWFLAESTTGYALTCSVVGLACALLSIPRGPVTERYGSWDRFVR
ncbi:Vitamin K epoxide reductase family protein [Tautonia plasticadhaerens]|uniref:Vitamin K epoxide reductase family protein n=2 Tax=Tautonia plasticadhaerens TaxID=2527974 RepID=A0A518H202_9BACT|nr:vitamin K epoxide reductase family protein [Tautonia plasticadhaerens]QDV34863.1 Vitamin K epoxide reductase family protein [Tautonia plasticadhaerens]